MITMQNNLVIIQNICIRKGEENNRGYGGNKGAIEKGKRRWYCENEERAQKKLMDSKTFEPYTIIDMQSPFSQFMAYEQSTQGVLPNLAMFRSDVKNSPPTSTRSLSSFPPRLKAFHHANLMMVDQPLPTPIANQEIGSHGPILANVGIFCLDSPQLEWMSDLFVQDSLGVSKPHDTTMMHAKVIA